MKNNKQYILIISLIAITAMVWNILSEPGIKELKGNFREVAFIRNEQNTGPVVRIYAVILDTENWKGMEQYGHYMPHTKYGTTRVYYFLSNTPYPLKLTFGEINISEPFKQNCIALFEKDGMSQASLIKYPFKKVQ